MPRIKQKVLTTKINDVAQAVADQLRMGCQVKSIVPLYTEGETQQGTKTALSGYLLIIKVPKVHAVH